MNEQTLDLICLQTLETKMENTQFKRVDSDVLTKLIDKGTHDQEAKFTERQEEALRESFESVLNANETQKNYFNVMFADLGEDGLPCVISQHEWSRRMKDNSKFQQQSWFSQMPDTFTLTLNTSSMIVSHLASDILCDTHDAMKPVDEEIDAKEKALKEVEESIKDINWDDLTEEQKKQQQDADKEVRDAREKKHKVFADAAKENQVIKQLIDVALLGAGLLKGNALTDFLKRTVSFIN